MGKKVTFILDEQVFEEAKQIVKGGIVKSLSFLIETALREKLDRIRKENIRQKIIDASRDPMVIADIQEIEQIFQNTDFEAESK